MKEPSAVVKTSGKKWRRPLLLALVGLFLILAAWGYVYFWLSRPVGRGPAGAAVDRRAFEKTWTGQKVLLLGVGDSVTAGFGVPPGHGYVARLADTGGQKRKLEIGPPVLLSSGT